MQLIFATNNKYKVNEIKTILPRGWEVVTLKEAGIDIEIPEPFNTLEENATAKSKTIYTLTHTNCFSEDTGLEVEALNGEPGVKSARYAGEDKSFEKNIDKLLTKLNKEKNRNARFRSVLSLWVNGKEFLFEGICEGKIITEKRGTKGFGYDPVFVPRDARKTFGEMDMEEKNQYSHRKKAADKLVKFLSNLIQNQ